MLADFPPTSRRHTSGVVSKTVAIGIACLLSVLVAVHARADSALPPALDHALNIHIAKYQGDKLAALSYTFDDGMRDGYTYVFPLFKELGYHGTFFIIGSVVPDTPEEAKAKNPGNWGTISWPELKEMADEGQEIGSHSWSHPNLVTIDDTTLHAEVDLNDAKIKEKLGFVPLTFAYPYNSYNDHVRQVVLASHVRDRDYCTGFGGPEMTVATANAFADDNIAHGTWGIAITHAITNGYAPFTSADIFRRHMLYVKSLDSKVWVDTMANVACYVAERDHATLTVSSVSDHKAKLIVNSTEPQPPYNVPLTVVVNTGPITRAKASRSHHNLPVEIVGSELLINAAPDAATIDVSWK